MMTYVDFCEPFKGKKITVMGLGLLGRGVGDATFLAECGAVVTVTDLKTEAELSESVERLRAFDSIQFVLGEHRMEDFENCDMVLVAAGVPIDSPYLAHAREKGIRLVQSAALFAELSKIPIIGVTGTRGKSTVTAMVHHVLSVVTGEHVIKGGNIRGVSNLQLLKDVKDDSLAVMELDSWQLQGFGWAEISPQIAVFTNFMDDHLNYYKGDREAYFADKANIFRYQEESGVFITTPTVFKEAKEFAKGKDITLGQEVVLADASVLPEDCLLAMPGEHNRLNAALAYEALKAVSLTDEEIFDGLASFPGVEGRLQYVQEVDGVKMYNDNNSTTPQATVAALRALGDADRTNVVLIAGGNDKGIDNTELATEIARYCKRVVLMPGTGTDLLKAQLDDSVPSDTYETLEEAVKAALGAAAPGDIVLFSPGFTSFGMFKNEYERNDRFLDLIGAL
ncbi:MAG: UDP-N-acetylmuramoyl-L-alanine--D-glutamate ligase [Candidatus Paceibacterota bacterium]